MEMKNICGKIPVELHEKLKLEVEELGISIPKYLEMVIESTFSCALPYPPHRAERQMGAKATPGV